MSRTSKFFVFRPWVEPSHSKNTNGDKLRLLSSPEGDAAEQRNANIKLAWFFSVVALFFLVVNHLGCVKNGEDANLGTDSTRVTLTPSPLVRSGEGAGFSVRFRLSNNGNHSVFYPISRTASIPIGELLTRESPSSEWVSLSRAPRQRVLAVQEFTDSNVAWMEMPPGGWVDGNFRDAGEAPEEHAYATYVKTARDASGIRIVSTSYSSSAH